MNRNLKIMLAALLLAIPVFAGAKSKVKHKKIVAKENFKLLEAYTQRTLPGIPGGNPPETATHFVIQWLAATNMESCFWRGENGWLTCNMQRAHKISPKDARNAPPGVDYLLEDGTGDGSEKGDTIMLTPMRGGKFPIPKEIPATAKNTLFYQTGGTGKWLAFPVKTITKKRDIAMP